MMREKGAVCPATGGRNPTCPSRPSRSAWSSPRIRGQKVRERGSRVDRHFPPRDSD